jgi:hypothetical protein
MFHTLQNDVTADGFADCHLLGSGALGAVHGAVAGRGAVERGAPRLDDARVTTDLPANGQVRIRRRVSLRAGETVVVAP